MNSLSEKQQENVTFVSNRYLLQVKGDSMIEKGIRNGDWVVIERRNHAADGDIVIACVDDKLVPLKLIYQFPSETLLIPANCKMAAVGYHPGQVEIQGVLVEKNRQRHEPSESGISSLSACPTITF